MTPQLKLEAINRQSAVEVSTPYIPVRDSEEMRLENGSPISSLSNLNALIEAGKKVRFVEMLVGNKLFVEFETGEGYLATGFSIGEPRSLPTVYLAEFLGMVTGDEDIDGIVESLVHGLGVGYVGPIPLMPPVESPKLPKIFKSQ